MAEGQDSEQHTVREKLRFFKSPLIEHRHQKHHNHDHSNDREGLPNLSAFGDREHPDVQRHDDSSILEVFFDLFFAANYTVFGQNQAVTNHARFKAYVGYFCLLWLTWFLITLFDVRFVTDSVFERLSRAIQLGVLVGFAVVAPNFDPSNQHMQTMRTMSIILCVSRCALAIEYGTILFHVRRYKKARLGLYIQIAINVISAAIYLGVTFRFHETRSRVFITWYVISGLEAIVTIVISNFYPILSFTQTHLMKRMSLLTVLILGDGIITVAVNVVKIVQKPDAWNPTIIGIITAATATIYFIFLIYFDWMKHDYLPSWRQQLWACLHLPFNLALVLFMAGFTQFIIWAKIVDAINSIGDGWILWDFPRLSRTASTEVQRNMTSIANDFLSLYSPKSGDTFNSIRSAIANITQIPNNFWPQYVVYETTGDLASISANNMPALDKINQIVQVLLSSMGNAVFESFDIDVSPDVRNNFGASASANDNNGNFQVTVNEKTWQRYRLIFAYGYISAGCALCIMTFLTVLSRMTPWKPWPIIRTAIYFLLSLAIGLVAVLFYHPIEAKEFLSSPWVLPTITFLWLIVLILTHIGNSPPLFFHRSRRTKFFNRGDPYLPVEVPLDTWDGTNAADRKRPNEPEIGPVDDRSADRDEERNITRQLLGIEEQRSHAINAGASGNRVSWEEVEMEENQQVTGRMSGYERSNSRFTSTTENRHLPYV